MIQLRDYQQRAIDHLYDWFSKGNDGNPCMVMPTGSGKSHIVAALCRDAIQNWPETRILMLTASKELIEQNAEKMRQYWPNAPMGIYSASIGKKQLGEPITFAGIQSVRNKPRHIGFIDLVIVDECHMISHKDEGGYRTFLHALREINPAIRVIGLTATPYRLGHGMITDKPAIFDDLLDPITIQELVAKGHLAPLQSKHTNARLDVSGVHKRGGEYIEKELQAAIDTDAQNEAVVAESIAKAGDRRSWLFFCAGVKHAQNIADILGRNNIKAACVTGETPKKEREQILRDFKAGKIRALTNANVLTTGFDAPNTDMVVMLRPTMSPSLYVQMAGRGMRPKEHTDHCLVLDFAGVVETHGPITAVQPPKKGGEGKGEAPVKICEACNELAPISAQVCPACGAPFPAPDPKRLALRNDDIMGLEGQSIDVKEWQWRKHVSRTSGKEMLAVTYYGDLSDPSVTEYFAITHDGYAGEKARMQLGVIASRACNSASSVANLSLDDAAETLTQARHPSSIDYQKDGKFYRVIKREWNVQTP